MDAKEKDIENAILDYLEYLPECFAWKNQSIGVFDPNKQIHRKSKNRFHLVGVSDILGLYKGKFLAVEVKDEREYKYLMKYYDEIRSGRYTANIKKKNHLRNQIIYIEKVKINGGIGLFACSTKQVQEVLKCQ